MHMTATAAAYLPAPPTISLDMTAISSAYDTAQPAETITPDIPRGNLTVVNISVSILIKEHIAPHISTTAIAKASAHIYLTHLMDIQ